MTEARSRRGLSAPQLAAIVLPALCVAGALLLRPSAPSATPLPPPPSAPAEALRPVAAFSDIADPRARSIALFREAGRVIQHPRCMNCHPSSDGPTQTVAMRPHLPRVTRGPDGGGAEVLRCTTCHQAANVAASGVPGNVRWRLAPPEMAWQGKSLGAICRQLLDPSRAHLRRDALLQHVAQDALVGWAWHPGAQRRPAPGSQAQFGALVAAWLETGAHCPA
jgi:hypothetical protein